MYIYANCFVVPTSVRLFLVVISTANFDTARQIRCSHDSVDPLLEIVDSCCFLCCLPGPVFFLLIVKAGKIYFSWLVKLVHSGLAFLKCSWTSYYNIQQKNPLYISPRHLQKSICFFLYTYLQAALCIVNFQLPEPLSTAEGFCSSLMSQWGASRHRTSEACRLRWSLF